MEVTDEHNKSKSDVSVTPHTFLLQLVRTCARHHQEQRKSEERSEKEREINLRHIASTIAREVEFFWSNIEQVRVCLVV